MIKFDSIQPQQRSRPTNSLSFLDQANTENPKTFSKPPRQPYAFFKVIILTILIVLILGAMYLSERVFAPSGQAQVGGFNIFRPLEQLANFLGLAQPDIIGENQDRINIVIAGVGGEGHDGPYLTDTLILASLKPSTQQISLVSIPRDLIVKNQNGEWVKINELYSQGRTTNASPYGKYMLSGVSQNFGLTTPYYLTIDFSGFSKLIDDLGGIDVNVEDSFTDYTYPTDNYKTMVVSFKAGWNHFNGEQALEFARSRHSADNNEGSDFARSKRQQLILKAVKEKAMSWQTLISPTKLNGLFQAFNNHIDTNLSIDQLWHVYSLFKNFDVSNLQTFVLDDSPENYLTGGTVASGAFVLQPKAGSWEPIQLLVNNIFSVSQIKAEQSKIVVLNGTNIPDLAFTVAQSLRNTGFTVTNFGNAPSKDFSKTIIYDFTNGAKKNSLTLLTSFLHGLPAPYLPDALQSLKKTYPDLDLLVILGQDQQTTAQPLIPWQATTSAGAIITSTLDIIDQTSTSGTL